MLRNAPTEDGPAARRRLGEILLAEHVISQEQLDTALAKQRESGQFLGQVLVELDYISHSALINFLVKQCRIPHINLLDYQIDEKLLALLPEEICLRYSVLPIDRLGRILTVAMVDPLDLDALDEIRQVQPELKIKPILCEWQHFEQAASRFFKLENEDDEQLSMSALGFSITTTKPPETEVAQETASAPSESPAESGTSTAPKSSAGSSATATKEPLSSQSTSPSQASANEFAQIVSKSIREAMEDSAAAISLRLYQASAADPSPSWEDMATLMRESVRDAMRETVGTLAKTTAEPAPVPMHELIEGLRESLRETMHEAFASVAESRNVAAPVQGPSAEELARLMQSSVRDAMREAINDLSASIQTPSDAMPVDAEAATALDSLRRTQVAQDDRIAKLSEAALEAAKAAQAAVQVALESRESQADEVLSSVQAAQEAAEQARAEAERTANQMETLSVNEQNRRALSRSGSQQRKRRQAAALLGKSESDALEALEGPQVELRIDERILAALESEAPLSGYTFENFIVGDANAFTLKISQAVAQQPGGTYNPCFIYGEVGVGKTHLINAIGNLTLSQDPERNIGYVSSSRFARRLTEALEEHALDAFREAYCKWDVLILDDIQFLGGRIEAQEEFFHIFNVLEQENRQIIIAGDKAPNRLGQLEQRLISRFGSGVVASLQPPDWQTRLAILHHYVGDAGVKIPDTILAHIATRATNDIRRMTGSLRKVLAYAELVGQDVTVDLVDSILSHLGFDSAE